MTFADWMQLAGALGGLATAAAVIVAVWTVRSSERVQNSLLVQQHIFEYLRMYGENADLFAEHPVIDGARYARLPAEARARLDVLAIYLIYTCDLLFLARDPRAEAYLKGLEVQSGALCAIQFDAGSVRSPEVLRRWNEIRRSNRCAPIGRLSVAREEREKVLEAAQ